MSDLTKIQIDQLLSMASTGFRHKDLDLSVARSNQVVEVLGNFLYLDKSSSGIITVSFNDQEDVPVQFGPGGGARTPFTRLFISNAAQPGKTARLIYAVGDTILPDFNIDTLQQIVDPVTVTPNDVFRTDPVTGASIFNLALTTDATLKTILAPASNVNGLKIKRAYSYVNTANVFGRMMAWTTTPGTWLNGMAILVGDISGKELNREFFIPAGYGLFYQQSAAQSGFVEVIYDLL